MLTQKPNPNLSRPTQIAVLAAAIVTSALAGTNVLGETAAWPEAPAAERAKAKPPARQGKPAAATDSGDDRGQLGVTVAEVPALLREHLRGRLRPGEGVVVVEVTPDSPAEKTGIQPGDVLVRLGDQVIHHPSQLAGLIAMLEAGTQIELTVIQRAERLRMALTAGGDVEEDLPLLQVAAGPTSVFTLRTHSGFATLTGDGQRYWLDLQYRVEQGAARRIRFSGSARQMKAKLARASDVPAELRDAVTGHLEGRITPQAVPIRVPN